jgi:Uma2 family endonuclease
MLRTRKKKFTPAEYLAMEEVAPYKSEYYRGEIFALSGGSFDHSVIQGNLIAALHRLLAGTPCRVVTSELRLHVRASDLYTYPDAAVVCGKVQFFERRNDTILNPRLIIEVLSPSTREYDRGTKFGMYKSIPSLQEYLLVDSELAHVECYRRRDNDEWMVSVFDGLDKTSYLESIDREVPLNSIYEGVTWLE